MEPGRTFDAVADLYDAHRSGYPGGLFSDLAAIAGLKPAYRVLEIGCGTGLATTGFVDRGFDVTAIDPGPSLIDIARRRFKASSNVRFAISTFEDWTPEPEPFRLVAAAQSWHWVRKEVGFWKAADALSADGHLAIFGHTPAWSTDLTARLEPVYLRFAPEIWTPPAENWYLPEGPIPGLVSSSGLFSGVAHRGYSWRRSYTARSFAAYLGTRSDYLMLPKERREALLRAVENALPQEFHADWVTNLYVAAARKG
jgi:SAM-dependent methyltransferase